MPHPRGWLLAGLVAGAMLAGCSDTRPTFAGRYGTDGRVSVGDGPLREGAVVVSVRKTRTDDKGKPIHARPGGALLKIPGVLPLTVEALEDGGDAFVLTFVLPADLVRELRARPRAVGGELFVPVDLSVPSFTGVDRLVPATAWVTVDLAAREPTPFPGLAARVGAFFRGLYSAR